MDMTFDQWIDQVDGTVRRRLGHDVRTEELSWDSAMWVGKGGTVVAALQNDETTAKFSFDAGDSLSLSVSQTQPDVADRALEKFKCGLDPSQEFIARNIGELRFRIVEIKDVNRLYSQIAQAASQLIGEV